MASHHSDDSTPTEKEVSKAVAGVSGQTLSTTQKMAVKFLLSNIAAGVIIGRGGTNITQLQQHSGARIQLSRSNEFYPGTSERVMLISGTVKSVLTALYLILTKLAPGRKSSPQQKSSKYRHTRDLGSQLKIVMPSIVCGAIIGKRGETIQHFAEDSKATISVSPQDHMCQNTYNRIVSISGGLEHMLRAVALVVSKVAGDPKYINNISLSVNYSKNESGYSYMPPGGVLPPMYGPAGVPPAMFPGVQMMTGHGPRMEVSMAVPDERIGAIIGKGGEIITQLQSLIGVKIIISGRNEFEPGTRNRLVTIIGPSEGLHIAQMFVSMKALRVPLDSMVYMERKYKERAMFMAPGGYRPPYAWHRNVDYSTSWQRPFDQRTPSQASITGGDSQHF